MGPPPFRPAEGESEPADEESLTAAANDRADCDATARDPEREAFLAALYAQPDDPWQAGVSTGGPVAASTVTAVDPWAHRRGEPRIFALMWALYVLAAVAGSVLWLAKLPIISTTSYNPAARTLLIVLAAGITVFWPMVRLSQTAPERKPVGAMLADVIVLLLPVQMVVWPMLFLAGWPLDVVGAVAGLLTGWAVIIGGVLAIAFSRTGQRGQRDRPDLSATTRSGWMVICLVLALTAPAVLALQPLRGAGAWGWLHACSPFTAVFAFTGDGWTGPTAPVQPWHWGGLLLTGSIGAALWGLALARAGAGRAQGDRLH